MRSKKDLLVLAKRSLNSMFFFDGINTSVFYFA